MNRRWAVAILLGGAAASLMLQAREARAEYDLCALRSGPKGPCTCKAPGDGAGQFTVVARSHCRKAAKAAQGKQDRRDQAGANSPGDAPLPAERPKQVASPTRAGAAEQGSSSIITGANPDAQGRRIDDVRARGKLNCGVNEGLLGFAHRSETGEWTGLDAEFCRAVATAVLGDAAKVEFIPLDATSRFEALTSGKVDVLSRNTTWTMDREAALGVDFAGVIYFDGQSFMTSEERGLVSAQQLAGATVCVQSATTTEANMAYYFASHDVRVEAKSFQSRDALVKAYLSGECDAYTADRSSLFADRAGFQEPSRHAVLPEVISKEPLGPAVATGDREWFQITRWVLAGLVNAEEVGLNRETAANGKDLEGDAKRLVEGAGKSGEKLRLDPLWLRKVITAVGNYGEVFEANVGRSGALGMERGMNSLWKKGGIIYAPPMW